jgi:hypothetical protein
MAAPSIQDLINSGVFDANPNSAVLIDGIYYQPVYGYGGSGMDAQQGALENVVTYKADENQVGGNVNWYDPTGQYQQSTQQQEVAGSFIEGLGEALTDPVVMAAILAAYSGGLLGGPTTGATGVGLDFAGSGNAFDLANAGITGGTASFTAAELAAIEAAQLANFELLNAGAGAFTPTTLTPVNTTPIITPTPIVPPVVTTPPVVTPPVVTPPPVVPPVVTPPVVPPVVTTPTVIPPIIPPTITELVKTLAPIAVPAIVATAVTPKTTTPTGFDIVPIPADWKTPPKPTVAPFTALSPINFGTQNLLKGTQFEDFLNANYGKVPEPVQYSQPSNLSYKDLMSILGSRQGMPSASSLSINDIISGIQNQYGQTPTRTMG